MVMDRMHTLDAEFLHLEDGVGHLHIAGIAVFEGAAPSEQELCDLIESKLHLIPRYRQRVRTVPLELGRPVWVDDPHFHLRYHVRHTALPAPGDDATLCRLMGRLMSQPLDPDRPLWETWLVEGLADDQWAIIFKVHHCMVDGISGVGLLTALLDIDPNASIAAPQRWTPEPEPTGASMVLGAWAGLVEDLVDRAQEIPGAVRHLDRTARAVVSTLEGFIGFGRNLRTTPPLSIEGSIGPHRSWAHSSVDLGDVKKIGATFGGTVNDVVLAAVTQGYRDLLVAHGEDPAEAVIRTLVPVSVRHGDGEGVPDNRVSALLLELPVDVADPVEQLTAVRERMSNLKASHMAEAGEWLTSTADLAPPIVIGQLSRLAVRAAGRLPQHSVNTVTTNVPGPQFPLFCLGRQMVGYRPFVPIFHGIRVATAILSYDGRIEFGVTGDYDTMPDVALLADGAVAAIENLVTHT
jgi:diacylglycerol O-acyltransferase